MLQRTDWSLRTSRGRCQKRKKSPSAGSFRIVTMATYRKLGTQRWRGKELRSALREDSMTNSLFDLSLVICTRNRAPRLAETLKKVSAIRSQLKWELIVADNGSTDETSAVVQEFAATCDHPVQLIVKPGRGV